MIESCQKCGKHENEDLCKGCNTCQRQHVQKYGIPWVQNREKRIISKPCIHICRFEIKSKQFLTYKCTKNMGHKGQCDFRVNTRTVERMARDSAGR